MKTKVLYTIAVIAVLLISVLFTGRLIQNKPVPNSNDKTENVLNVKSQKAEYSKYEANIKYRGRVYSFENISLSAEVSGKIIQGDIPFKAGQEFKKNDLLIHIYSDDVKASLMSGRSNFLRTLSSILPDINYDFPEEYEKWKTFFNNLKVDQKMPELPQINSEQEQIYLASKGVLTEYYLLKQQEINLKKYTIHAPFNGSFKIVNREIGSVANMGAELASIIRTDKMEIVVPVLPEDAKWIKNDDEVILIGEDSVKKGKVARIAGFVDQSTQSINIYVNYYPSESQAFFIGEFIDVKFSDNKKIEGIKIPREALLDDNQVFIIKNNTLSLKSVVIERSLEDYFIISGITNGEIIVSESLADVPEGTKVNAII